MNLKQAQARLREPNLDRVERERINQYIHYLEVEGLESGAANPKPKPKPKRRTRKPRSQST